VDQNWMHERYAVLPARVIRTTSLSLPTLRCFNCSLSRKISHLSLLCASCSAKVHSRQGGLILRARNSYSRTDLPCCSSSTGDMSSSGTTCTFRKRERLLTVAQVLRNTYLSSALSRRISWRSLIYLPVAAANGRCPWQIPSRFLMHRRILIFFWKFAPLSRGPLL
jgi:hypothetical protein